jgi:acyl-CoA reductase-like NAD-dependent aldehyde dehydrogenase
LQKLREGLLKEMLQEFNEGRSKTYYCIASTVLEIEELETAVKRAREAQRLDVKEKARFLHAILDDIAEKKHYYLKLRK